MKRICRLIVFVTIALLVSGTLFAANPTVPKCKTPILISSFGQCQDSNTVNLLAKRLKLDVTYDIAVDPSTVDWSKYGTIIGVVGGSGKGLGSAGLDIPTEVKRIESLLADAKKAGVTVICMHIGGVDRRGVNSQPFLPFMAEADFAVVKENGNEDGYFTKLCNDAGVPLYTVKATTEIQKVLQEMFQ